MKQITLWTTAIVSALFVVMVCIDSHNWELLGIYAVILAVWMVIGWYWCHRFDLQQDVRKLLNCTSPLKCKWIGTVVLFLLFALLIILVIVGALVFFATQLLKVF